MDISKEEQQRRQFKDILFDLSEDQSMLQDKGKRAEMYRRLENLYYNKDSSKKFRHYYSDIFQVLDEINQHSEKGNRNILGQNLDILRQGYQAKNINDNGDLIDISDSIRKLYDHVNLEIARMDYSDAGDWRISQEEKLQKVRASISELNDKHVEMILTDAERQYLAAVIRPFRDRTIFVKKTYHNGHIGACEQIVIRVESITSSVADIPLPFFKEGEMYKGMKLEREYTLEELGL